MSSTSPPMIEHPSLGKINGIFLENSTIEQFRGVPFGRIPRRWADPELLSGKLSQDIFDATRHGPCCPQGAGGQEFDVHLVGDMKFQADPVAQSETDCLNLVVTRPVGLLAGTKVPVMVWCLRGAFSVGCNAWPQYDLAKFVQCSFSQGKPVICVSINYRLGIFGFLASKQADISGNYGLKDQICAFQWIKQNIEGFGGCPNSVTAFGESAGAISLSTLLATSEPLFSRVILMSGDVSLRRPRTAAWQDALLGANLKHLGLEIHNLTEALERLYELPAAEIVQTIPLVQHWSPTLDHRFLPGLREEDFYIENTWCKYVMIGEMAHDGTILRSRYLDDPQAREKTLHACDKILGASMSCELQNLYDLSADEPYLGMLKFISELRFYLPVVAAARGLKFPESVQVQEYHMDQTNPFEGDFHGVASHALDVGYLLRNFDPWLDEAGSNFGKKMLRLWVNFAYGEDQVKNKVLSLGVNHGIVYSRPEEYDLQVRQGRAKILLRIGLAKSVALGEQLQGVPEPDL
ncbi:para-nitrobenzyl esterase [Stagonosporopsis vannaccii]|nr:para-nitrobenzyl esterase [Stagonosporopsis vannaccii]